MSKVESILIVEDELLTAMSYAVIYRSSGLKEVHIATTVEQARKIFHESKPGLILMDIRLKKNYEGLELAEEFLKENPDLRIVFISGYDISDIKEKIGEMKKEILVKPVSEFQLKGLIT